MGSGECRVREQRSGQGVLAAFLCALFVFGPPAARAAAPDEAPAIPTFARDVRPALAGHCFKCHGPRKHKGGVNLSAFADEKSVLRQRKLWRRVARQIEALEMPPAGERPLAPEHRQQLLAWIRQAVNQVDGSNPADRNPGRALIRRLNRSEYNRTVRDLVGVGFDVAGAVGMPEEATGQGFANLAEALNLSPALMDKYFAAADKVLDRVSQAGGVKPGGKINPPGGPRARQAYETLFRARPGAGLTQREAARQVIARFARRAYRRPIRDREVERLLKLYDLAVKKGERFDGAVRLMLKAVLVSPHFLFRIEQDRAPEGSEDSYPVSDHELAVRLSYFLWGSLPDDELSDLADAKKLSAPAVLERQVKRMLADPRARALTDDFAVQWLQLRKLADARPSTEFFPTFTPQLRQAMYDETVTFFDKLREEDGSLLRLLDADYTYLNQDLARHYNIPGVAGPKMRRVGLQPDDHRGGLLGMAGILALTSHTSRTSPTLRGKWVLEVIFGTPPPPPPADAGKLDENKTRGKTPGTFRELLAQHASKPACASCHARIDPLGFGLDNYDAIGRWRDGAGGQALDTSGQLPGGEKFNGPAGLKRLLVRRRDAFARNLGERMLTYALGRELQDYDEWTVKEVTAALGRDGYRFSALVTAIVKSYPFRYRRNTDSVPDEGR